MTRCELSWCARLLASFSVRGRNERTGIREIRTPNQHARAGQVRSHDATTLPAIVRGFLAGKKRRRPD
jgi:hypothetical protein